MKSFSCLKRQKRPYVITKSRSNKPEIDDNYYRYYDFKDLEKLRQIFFLRDIDLSIEEIQKLDQKLIERIFKVT